MRSRALRESRVVAVVWAMVGLMTLAAPTRHLGVTYIAIGVAQAAHILVAVRRRRGVIIDRLACYLLAAAVVVWGAEEYAKLRAVSAGTPAPWRTLQLAFSICNLTLSGVAAVAIAQPFLRLATFRRSARVALAAFAAVAGAHTWGHYLRSGWVATLLMAIVCTGAVVGCAVGVQLSRKMVAVGRPAERYALASGGMFALGQVVARVLDRDALDVVPTAFIVVASGWIVAMVVHPGGARLGQRLHRHSDRPVVRSSAVALGALVAADGLLVVLAEVLGPSSAVWWLAVAGSIQFVAVSWAFARAVDAGTVRGFLARRRVDADLHHAMRVDAIAARYQPVLRTSDAACVGFAAQVAWDHPSLGFLDGSHFMDRAAAHGYLATIDRQMLQSVGRDICGLLAPLAADERFVSINVASWRLEQRGFAAEVTSTLTASNVDLSQLIIEISASGGVFNWSVLSSNVSELREHGILVALGEFGGSATNLGLLCKLEIDLVKLDPALVAAAMDSPRGAAVAAGIVEAVTNTGARVMADGVEDFAWMAPLGRMGVTFAQGHGIGRPAPVSAAEGLAAWRN